MKECMWRSTLVVFLGALITGCGGGGGGGVYPVNTGEASLSYNGVTTQATVTESNKQALSYNAYQAGLVGSALASIGKVVAETPASTTSVTPLPQSLYRVLEDAILGAALENQKSAPRLVGKVVTESGTIPGPNGGSAKYSISADDVTGSFTGTIEFNNYQDIGTTLSGSANFSGVINLSNGQLTSFSLSMVSLHAIEAGTAVTLAGTITKSPSGADKIITISLVIRYDSTGVTYWVKDYNFIVKTDGTMTLTGRYYDPVYGYVDITTVTPLTISAFDAMPTAGVLLFTGSNGTSARLTFTSNGYNIVVT